MKLKTLLLSVFVLLNFISFGQDKKADLLYLINKKKPVEVKVIEINTTEVKVKKEGSDVLYTYSKYEVSKIEYANGQKENFDASDQLSLEFFPNNKLNAIKVSPLALLSTNLPFYWERIIKPGHSYEAELRIIGIGRKNNFQEIFNNPEEYDLTPKGINVGFGYKAIRVPDLRTGKMFMRNLLQGSYLKPRLNLYLVNQPILTRFRNPNTGAQTVQLNDATVFGSYVGVDFGRQWALGDRIVLDVCLGAGLWMDTYGKQYEKIIDDNGNGFNINPQDIANSSYGFTRINQNAGIGVGLFSSIKLGYAFDLKRDREIRKKPK